MTRITILKLIFAAIAAVLFAVGVRNDAAQFRWAAIAFLAAAVMLRFVSTGRKR